MTTPTPGGPAESETLWERLVHAGRYMSNPRHQKDARKAEFARILAEVEREATRRALAGAAAICRSHADTDRDCRKMGAGIKGREMADVIACEFNRLAPAPTGGPDVTPKPAPAGGD